jgi:hypothetical protein
MIDIAIVQPAKPPASAFARAGPIFFVAPADHRGQIGRIYPRAPPASRAIDPETKDCNARARIRNLQFPSNRRLKEREP